MSIENKTKVEVSPARIRELRKEHGYSHQQLADKIIKLVDKKKCSQTISKSALHRLEVGAGNQKLRESQLQGLAIALDVSVEALVVSPLLNARHVDLWKLTEGKQFLEALREADLIEIEIAYEPADDDAQKYIIDFVESSQNEHKQRREYKSLVEATKAGFEFRQFIENLASKDIFIYAGHARQIMPCDIQEGGWNEWYAKYYKMSKESYEYNEDHPNPHTFDGEGFCNLLVIKIDDYKSDFVTSIIDLDPIGLASKSRYPPLIENVERIKAGVNELDDESYHRKPPLSDFISLEARNEEEKIRASQANESDTDF